MTAPCAPVAKAGAHGRCRTHVATIVAVAASGCAPPPEPGSGAEPPIAPLFPALADMVLVPGPGDSAAGRADDLLIDRFEVTDGEYAAFLAATAWQPSDPDRFLVHWRVVDGRRLPPESDTPVRHVSFADAEAYAAWRGKAIPTRDEWLSACSSLKGGELPWQPRAFTGACNSAASDLLAPMPVGSYELGRSAPGCYDMIGNVAEWTATPLIGPELRFVVGGSFLGHCSFAYDADEPGGGISGARGRREQQDDAMRPWLESVALGQRRADVGFRCVRRDAADVLDAAFARVEQLAGAERSRAIDELLRVGDWVFGENRLLPFVRARAFEKRVRVERMLAAGDGAPLRGEIGVAPSGDAFLWSEPGVLRVLDGKDAHELRRIELPFAPEPAREPWIRSPWGGDATWMVGPLGEIAVVDLATGRVAQAPPPAPGADLRLPTWAIADAGGGGTWFVQKVRVEHPGDLPPDAPRPWSLQTRVVRFDSDDVREVQFESELFETPAPAGPDGLLLLTIDALDVELPGRTVVPFSWMTMQLLGHDLATRSRWMVVYEERRAEGGAPGEERRAEGGAPGDERRAEGGAPGDERRGATGVWRFVPEGGGAPVEVETAANAPRYVVPLALASRYVLDDGAGRPWLLAAEGGAIAPPRPLAAPGTTTPARATALPVGESGAALPLLVGLDGRQLWRIDAAGGLRELLGSLELGGLPDFAASDRGGRHLLLRTRQGRWAGVALGRARRTFALDLGGEASIDVRLFATTAETLVASQPTPHSAWVRRLSDGAQVDALGLARPTIRRVLLLDADHDGAGETWTLLGDGRLVALGPREPRTAALVEDFEAALRRREALRDGGR